MLRFGREVAFSAATVYASAAEARGAWDARLEALVVDAVVRGEAAETLLSRASALGWDPAAETTVLVGEPPAEEPPEPLHAVRRAAHRAGATVLLGTHGAKLVMIAGPGAPLGRAVGVVRAGRGRRRAARSPGSPRPTSARRARWPGTARSGRGRVPRAPWPPTTCSPSGCSTATPGPSSSCVARSRRRCARPAASSRPPSSATSTSPAVLEAAARALYVHPNTVRYRLRRVAEVTGRHPGEARGALVLRLALVLDRLHSGASPG